MNVDGNIGIYDGVIRIICGDNAKTIFLTAMGTDDDQYITLDDCLKLIGRKENGDVCVVIFDNALHGEIYQFGNYGEFWTEYGNTQGYA